MLDQYGVRQAIPSPASKVSWDFKNKKKTAKRVVFNYPQAAQYVWEFKQYARRFGRRPLLVYEHSNPRPFQNINGTRTAIISIEMWPVIAACYDIECRQLDSSQWKRQMQVQGEKSVAIAKAKELCPKFEIDNYDGLAEAMLLGYHFLQQEQFNG